MDLLQKIIENKHLCFIDGATETTYSLSELLFEFPVSKSRTLVFLYLDNSIQSLACYLSAFNTVHTLVLLNNQLDISLKNSLELEYNPAMIYDATRNEIETYKLIDSDNGIIYHKETVQHTVHPNCKLMLSTSGTTGSPKFVKLSEENLIANATSIAEYLPIQKEDVTPLNLPLHYSYGLSVLHSNMLSGGKIVCGLPDILQREFWSALEQFKFSSLAGVPFVYEMLKRIGFLKKSYPSIRYISQAGGNLNINIKNLFIDYCFENNIEFYVMYGQTEATARISYVPPAKLKDKITSIGLPIPKGTLSLDPETSELMYEGPNVFGGYAVNKNDLTLWETIEQLRTGDIARKDEDGYFYITGRIKRFVKLFGNRINLDDVERFINRTFTTVVSACVGIEDTHLLMVYEGAALDVGEIKKVIFEMYRIHPKAIKIQQLTALPLTGNGKIDYKNIGLEYDL